MGIAESAGAGTPLFAYIQPVPSIRLVRAWGCQRAADASNFAFRLATGFQRAARALAMASAWTSCRSCRVPAVLAEQLLEEGLRPSRLEFMCLHLVRRSRAEHPRSRLANRALAALQGNRLPILGSAMGANLEVDVLHVATPNRISD